MCVDIPATVRMPSNIQFMQEYITTQHDLNSITRLFCLFCLAFHSKVNCISVFQNSNFVHGRASP